jgi:uncharacterized protein (DUF2461 family)
VWRYRARVDDDQPGGELMEVVADLDKAGYALAEDRLTRMPRGYSPDHPRAELIRLRTVIARRDLGTGAWLHPADVVGRVRASFDGLLPLMSWFVKYVTTDGLRRGQLMRRPAYASDFNSIVSRSRTA